MYIFVQSVVSIVALTILINGYKWMDKQVDNFSLEFTYSPSLFSLYFPIMFCGWYRNSYLLTDGWKKEVSFFILTQEVNTAFSKCLDQRFYPRHGHINFLHTIFQSYKKIVDNSDEKLSIFSPELSSPETSTECHLFSLCRACGKYGD